MIDAGQACDCRDGEPQRVSLDGGAADAIDDAIRVEPEVDWEDTQTRLIASIAVGPGLVAGIFWFVAVAVWTVWPAIEEQWPYLLGIPWGIITVLWIAFFLYSEVSQRRPYYRSGSRTEALEGKGEKGVIEEGRVEAFELHQQRQAKRPVIRDAFLATPLVLRRTNETITVPAGRIELIVPEERWRKSRSVFLKWWTALPEAIYRAGMLMEAKATRGEEVELLDGALEEESVSEGTFRRAAETRLRWVPKGGRVRLRLVEARAFQK